MPSLVLQLQAAALDRAVAISDLLRMALATASKLDIAEIEDWLRHELGGYRGDAPVPEYRKLKGELKAQNPYHGWLPVQFATAEVQERYSVGIIGDPISAIEQMVEGSAVVGFGFPAEADINIRKAMNYNVPILLHIPSSTVSSILDAVRNRILDWSLELEKAGVLGDEMSFSDRDQQRAQTINIAGNVGVIGDLAGPANVAASTSGPTNQSLNLQAALDAIKAVRAHITCIPDGKQQEIVTELDALEAEAHLDRPDTSKLRVGLRKLGEVAGNIGDKVIEAGVKALVDRALVG